MLILYVDTKLFNEKLFIKYIAILYPNINIKKVKKKLKESNIFNYLIFNNNVIELNDKNPRLNNVYEISAFSDLLYHFEKCNEKSFLLKINNNYNYKEIIYFLIKHKYIKNYLDGSNFLNTMIHLEYNYLLCYNNELHGIYNDIGYEIIFKNRIKEYTINDCLRNDKLKKLL